MEPLVAEPPGEWRPTRGCVPVTQLFPAWSGGFGNTSRSISMPRSSSEAFTSTRDLYTTACVLLESIASAYGALPCARLQELLDGSEYSLEATAIPVQARPLFARSAQDFYP